MRRLNRWVSRHIVKASATQNMAGEKVGAINRAFAYFYGVHLAGRRVKEWNRRFYYALKYSLVLGLVATVFYLA